MPIISVIIPCYNQDQYLDECLQSVSDQTYTDWECIIVDDGSLDHTEDVVKKWIEKDSRFQYLKKINEGVSSARNLGIEKASGEWILPLDGDDKIGSKYLELASKEFQNNVDIIYSIGEYFGEKSGIFASEPFDYPSFLMENQIFCSAFFKKSDWKKIGGYDTAMKGGYEDWEFWIHLSADKNQLKVKHLNEICFFYRIKPESRNVDAMQKNDASLRDYIYHKHPEVFYKNLNSLKEYYHENQKLKRENQHLKNLVNSKRNVLMNRILNFFGK
ncbi:glycosyltransferase family 2 protein [Chryseobacterium taiwanense]|uniref:Glycosyltransferase 2-like domain-containing protein n=1 Tax=Chryseobacterium taiwanense TaxID=363331 RepID=A0A0B4DKP1_9FLAO|nr:glycosyltransferase family A protein [Chryseobacterium taiwanense]KIC64990.1 hypothetical protein RM51_00585 [Chryseobacterium taiwanense]